MNIEQALAEAKLYTDGKYYLLVKLPANAITPAASVMAELGEPFSAMIVDKDEITLVIPADAWNVFTARLLGATISEIQYRLITFDIPLDLALVGFMARISRALAEAGVPIMVYAAFSRDHLLVPAEHFEKAWATLERLKQ
jgi:hypothetical protein